MAGLVGQHLLHLRLGGGQPRACLAEPLDALFEQLQRLVQVELLPFEPPHDLLEAVELLCEAQGLAGRGRSEEHTSELQSHVKLVCRLLLEKKKTESVPKTNRNIEKWFVAY